MQEGLTIFLYLLAFFGGGYLLYCACEFLWKLFIKDDDDIIKML